MLLQHNQPFTLQSICHHLKIQCALDLIPCSTSPTRTLGMGTLCCSLHSSHLENTCRCSTNIYRIVKEALCSRATSTGGSNLCARYSGVSMSLSRKECIENADPTASLSKYQHPSFPPSCCLQVLTERHI